MLHLFSFFHLNLAFSSLEEEARPEVIRRCYWPLLRLIREQHLPVGIEASGYTLEEIQLLAPEWVTELRELCREGLVEFIGSGYSQMIGPLVPAAVNRANQRIGLRVYEELLGFRPELVLVNEQAYSAGLVPIYREAGYRALIMEWDNPGSSRPGWNPDWRYLPQYACGADGSTLPVIWNKSIPFQKFQRYTHGEMELPEYLDFLGSRVGREERTFSLYGNDAEIFDFRPGRFKTEAVMSGENEWSRIAKLYEAVQADSRCRLIRPSQVLEFLDRSGAGNLLHLESAAQPVPVKKQAKYNVMRWALTGRDDLCLNTACWRLYEALAGDEGADESDWKELCYLWSSDFRTHITAKRWEGVQGRLETLQQRMATASRPVKSERVPALVDDILVCQNGAFLEIETPQQRLRLNCRRGLAVDGWWDKAQSDQPLIKTLPHGYFDDIHYGADFYTGHFVLEIPGQHKVTDLSPVTPEWNLTDDGVVVRAEIRTRLGPVEKEVRLLGSRKGFELIYHFRWPECPNGTLRLGHVTVNPELFQQDSLFYRTHNGGETREIFHIQGEPINHLAPVSALVSASHGLGVTGEVVGLGDYRTVLNVGVDKSSAALTGHIAYAPVDDRYFFRLVFSAMEMDDTSCHVASRTCFENRIVRLWIS
ncbi:Glycosyl hydrolase family 57 [Geoalkalibacter ferrihydriticus]|uniref:Glycoside hydrolase family 57 n=3 Tax=Geoalkalibacter ferrihydriticus TaxID=392333 RepID=A0A0C2HL51_9BACT|nr:glycoside hydrolase family 57 [Geoalkalibacter ferrihydriticus DSM 17813]SDM75116.1 Glycosyl hydrolase family 57 [Geoalkalibacter ferrihydriticus]